MFYLTKRIDEKQCTIGDRCMVLADFSGIPSGTKGFVHEIYNEGVMIEWLTEENDRQKVLGHNPLRDGFSRGELEYLAFATQKHPKVDATVYSNENDR